MDPASILVEIGLSKNESSVYLTLLRQGETTATVIAEHSRLHRPNVYDAVERLQKKGLVSYTIKNKKRLFRASDPKRLLAEVREKEKKIEQLLPRLELEKKLSDTETNAEVYKGLASFRRALESLLEYKKTIYAFGIAAFVPDMLKSFIEQFHKNRIRKKIIMKHIYNQDAKERIRYLNSMPYTEAAYLPEEFSSPTTTLVCGEEILLVNWKPLTFVRIINPHLAEAYTRYCNLMLRSAKKIT